MLHGLLPRHQIHKLVISVRRTPVKLLLPAPLTPATIVYVFILFLLTMIYCDCNTITIYIQVVCLYVYFIFLPINPTFLKSSGFVRII